MSHLASRRELVNREKNVAWGMAEATPRAFVSPLLPLLHNSCHLFLIKTSHSALTTQLIDDAFACTYPSLPPTPPKKVHCQHKHIPGAIYSKTHGLHERGVGSKLSS
jgi:hypothetical protein